MNEQSESLVVQRMGFTKLDECILQSSIMAEDSDTFKIWIALIASCKQDGVSRVSPIFLSAICHIDIEIVSKILTKLQSPDPYSRSKEDDGRRIRVVEDGYYIINYNKYRNYSYSETKGAARKRKYRERKINELSKLNETNIGQVLDISASSSEYYLVCICLRDKIINTGSSMKITEYQLKSWANEIRLMVEQDNRTIEQIRIKIEEVFNDGFWSGVIRSAGTLRQRWNEGKLDRLCQGFGGTKKHRVTAADRERDRGQYEEDIKLKFL